MRILVSKFANFGYLKRKEKILLHVALDLRFAHPHTHLKCLWDGKSIFGNQTLIRQIEIGKIQLPAQKNYFAKLERCDRKVFFGENLL